MRKLFRIPFFIFCFSTLIFILNILNEYKCIRGNSYFIEKKIKTISTTQDLNINNKRQSIFCIILTQQENLQTKVKTIYETWGQYCDNLRFNY